MLYKNLSFEVVKINKLFCNIIEQNIQSFLKNKKLTYTNAKKMLKYIHVNDIFGLIMPGYGVY